MQGKTKIAYNTCYGGFSLSAKAVQLGRQISGDPAWAGVTRIKGEPVPDDPRPDLTAALDAMDMYSVEIPRHDPVLIQVIETLGSDADGKCASIAIKELDPGTKYRIDEYDGREWVATPDDYEWETA